ncbi:HGL058Wp [Eremothecium sinecaudum]|uniref:HGL058Wp n=1 Tax=Eremothecium sinecaudum TaxID=45286 RepID=A0A0X8HVH0_9SACH|nr:HGL058Wp [Eremothecium sinecaudum]AMD22282.1 HGL058Wp [Eremothecium sinecaudum]
MDRPIDEIVKSLLQFVVRGFYSNSYVLVLDAILFHSVLSEEDLAHLLGIKRPELRALTSTLVDDMLVATHSQQEFSYNSRSLRRYYYYIKYPQAIDAIKWKVHQLVSKMKEDLDSNSAPQGYMCPVCNSKYSQLEAVSLLNFEKTQFLCSLCEEPLVEDDSGKKCKEKQMRLNRLMDQVQPIIDYLKKIDDSMIEENTFETALARLIPPQNNSAASYTMNPRTRRSKMFQPGESLSNESSRRAGQRSQATLHVNITTASDELAQKELQERKAEEKRKQNALPTWHENSTIGKSLGRLDGDEAEASGESAPNSAEVKVEEEIDEGQDEEDGSNDFADYRQGVNQQTLANKEAERALAEYYAKLAKKQAMEDEDDDEDEEEDEEEFEDVIGDGNGEEEEDEDMKDLEEIGLENVTKDSVVSNNDESGNSARTDEQQDKGMNDDDDEDEEELDAEFEDV